MAESRFRSLVRKAARPRGPRERLHWTRDGIGYLVVWLLLLATGLYQQINLVLLIAGLAAGPMVASLFVSRRMVRGLALERRAAPFVFAGQPLVVEYLMSNRRRWTDALAVVVEDELVPIEPVDLEAPTLEPRAFFPRVPVSSERRISWREAPQVRGRYRFRHTEMVTRSPFGLLERRTAVELPGEVVVYPRVGRLTRNWRIAFREASETRRGNRHDRSTQQQEYHGLRDYRPGDSPRWIHWRTTAKLGEPMVREFEQQQDQDLAILLDPWVPAGKVTHDQREAVEQAIRFVASVSYDICRLPGRKLMLGWSGAPPVVIHGPASVRLLHEMLEALALLRPSGSGRIAQVLDAMPPPMLREAFLLVVSTRPVKLSEEVEVSTRLGDLGALRISQRAFLFDASKGELDGLVTEDPTSLGLAEPPVPTRSEFAESTLTLEKNDESITSDELAVGSQP